MKLQIGETLKCLRKEKGITQEELAEVLGVSCQSVSRWELGICYPDIELLPEISDFFAVTADKLLGTDSFVERDNRSCQEIMRSKWMAHSDFDAVRDAAAFQQIMQKLS